VREVAHEKTLRQGSLGRQRKREMGLVFGFPFNGAVAYVACMIGSN